MKRDGRLPSLLDYYDETLRLTFHKALINFESNTLEYSVKFLKTSWGKEWIKNTNAFNLVVTPSSTRRDSRDRLRSEGIDAIIRFTDMLMDEFQVPIIIGRRFYIDVAPNIVVTGTWEYIREVEVDNIIGSRKLQLIHIVPKSNRFHTSMQACNDIEMVGQAFAFETMFDNKPEMVYLDIMKDKMVSSLLGETKKKEFIHTVKSVADCINHNIRCVSPDNRCFHCELRNDCMNERRR